MKNSKLQTALNNLASAEGPGAQMAEESNRKKATEAKKPPTKKATIAKKAKAKKPATKKPTAKTAPPKKAVGGLFAKKAPAQRTAKPSKAKAKKASESTAKVAPAKKPNLHKIKFGKAMTVAEANKQVKRIHKGTVSLEKGTVSYDGHYWWAVAVDTKSGIKGNVRLDYLLNYERLPKAISCHRQKESTAQKPIAKKSKLKAKKAPAKKAA